MVAKPRIPAPLRALAGAALTGVACGLIGLPLLAVLLSTSPRSFSWEQWGLLLASMLIGAQFAYREGPIVGFTSALLTTLMIGIIHLVPAFNPEKNASTILVLLVATFIGSISERRVRYVSMVLLMILALVLTSLGVTIIALLLVFLVVFVARSLGWLLKYWLSPLQSAARDVPYLFSFGAAGIIFVTIFALLYNLAYLINPNSSFASALPASQGASQGAPLNFFDFLYFSVCTALPGSAHIIAANAITQAIAMAELLLSPGLLVIYFSLLMRRIPAASA